MYTIDASVHLSALNPVEAHSDESRAFLAVVQRLELPLVCPTLLPVEVAAAVARALGDVGCAVALAATLKDLPNQALVPLDAALADRAIELAAAAGLRGADAVYGAVAQQYGAVLVTLDRQPLEQLSPAAQTAHPADALRDIELKS